MIVLAAAASAGPWIQPPGGWYAKASFAEFRAGNVVRYVGRTADLYAEVGLLPGVQVVFDLPYVSASNRFEGSIVRYVHTDLGTARVAVGVGSPRVPLSVHVAARLPLGLDDPAPPIPGAGDRQVDVDVVGAAGVGAPVASQPCWASAELGWRAQTGWTLASGADAHRGAAALYRAQIGVTPRRHGRALGWTSLELSGVVELGGPRAAHEWSAGVAAAVRHGLHVEVGVTQVYAARVAAEGWRWSVGLSHLRRPAR